MKKKYPLILIPLFLYLLLAPQTALSCARNGLLLWHRSVLPVLFPFLFLCGIALRLNAIEQIPAWFCRPLAFLFGCSKNGVYAIVTGFLCGFPIGAKVTYDLERLGRIDPAEARFLYGFVNNLSPAFLLSFAASAVMQDKIPGILYVFCVLGSSILYGIVTSLPFRRRKKQKSVLFAETSASDALLPPICLSKLLDDCIQDAARSIVHLGAYMMLFSILTGAFTQAVDVSHPIFLFLASCIEVTNGTAMIGSSQFSLPVRFLLINTVCAFGGLSALAQSVSIASMHRSTLFYYIKSRVTCTLLCLTLSVIVLLLFVRVT